MKAHAMFILICILLLNACTKMPVGTGYGASEKASDLLYALENTEKAVTI